MPKPLTVSHRVLRTAELGLIVLSSGAVSRILCRGLRHGGRHFSHVLADLSRR